jgi:hypothetical protein
VASAGGGGGAAPPGESPGRAAPQLVQNRASGAKAVPQLAQ